MLENPDSVKWEKKRLRKNKNMVDYAASNIGKLINKNKTKMI